MDERVAEMDQIAGKESWAAEDVARLQQLLLERPEPIRWLREKAAAMQGQGPSPTGVAAVKLGIILHMLCQFDRALEFLAKGTDNKERHYYQALCCKQVRQWGKAIEEFQLAEDRGWDARQATLGRAEVEALSGDVASATKSVDRFARSSQESADWHHIAGMVAEMQGEQEKAVELYEKARQLEPGHPGATFRLAYFRDLHGEDAEAASLYRECIRATSPAGGIAPGAARKPIYANALLNLAVLYEDAEKYDEAARCLRRILSVNPNHARARLFLRDIESAKTMTFDEDEAKRQARRNDLLAIPVTDFELSVRARNCLKKMNIRTLGDLLNVTEAELLTYKNFGETSLAEIKGMLTSKGLRLGQMLDEEAEAVASAAEPEEPSPSVGNEGLLGTPLAQIEFSVRARRALETLGVRTLGELTSKSEEELMACRNFGQTSLNEVLQRLTDYGLSLRAAQ